MKINSMNIGKLTEYLSFAFYIVKMENNSFTASEGYGNVESGHGFLLNGTLRQVPFSQKKYA